jgi:hypothetical protein
VKRYLQSIGARSRGTGVLLTSIGDACRRPPELPKLRVLLQSDPDFLVEVRDRVFCRHFWYASVAGKNSLASRRRFVSGTAWVDSANGIHLIWRCAS